MSVLFYVGFVCGAVILLFILQSIKTEREYKKRIIREEKNTAALEKIANNLESRE